MKLKHETNYEFPFKFKMLRNNYEKTQTNYKDIFSFAASCVAMRHMRPMMTDKNAI